MAARTGFGWFLKGFWLVSFAACVGGLVAVGTGTMTPPANGVAVRPIDLLPKFDLAGKSRGKRGNRAEQANRPNPVAADSDPVRAIPASNSDWRSGPPSSQDPPLQRGQITAAPAIRIAGPQPAPVQEPAWGGWSLLPGEPTRLPPPQLSPPLPNQSLSALSAGLVPVALPSQRAAPDGMVLVKGGRSWMGNNAGNDPTERPEHEVMIEPFWMDITEVTNEQFAAFVKSERYQTTAERAGKSAVFLPEQARWVTMTGADWQHPEGPQCNLDGREDWPVVHISWVDAAAYAAWAGKRLPTEAEWECAARNGQRDAVYPWGRDLLVNGKYQANFWQGRFPDQDLSRDGFWYLAPIACYPPNPLGIYDQSGNVWEWCADWYDTNYYADSGFENPGGPTTGTERSLRGGSYLSAENTGGGIQVFNRRSADPLLTRCDIGFRCVRSVNGPRLVRRP